MCQRQGPIPAPGSHVFIVTTEQTGPYLETETHTIGTYASYQDALWKAKVLENESDEADFTLTVDGERTVFWAEDDEGDRYEITVERHELLPAGSEHEPGTLPGNQKWKEEREDPFTEIKALQQRRGVLVMCKGAGCREPLCLSITHTLPT